MSRKTIVDKKRRFWHILLVKTHFFYWNKLNGEKSLHHSPWTFDSCHAIRHAAPTKIMCIGIQFARFDFTYHFMVFYHLIPYLIFNASRTISSHTLLLPKYHEIFVCCEEFDSYNCLATDVFVAATCMFWF